MGRYIVLRDVSRNWTRAEVPLYDRVVAARPEEPPEPEILTLELTPAELRDIPRDPCFLAAAPSMPTRLVNPEPLDDLRAEEIDPGWALEAVRANRTVFSGAGVRVAVLDTGIDTGHPAFKGFRPVMRDFAGSGVEDANGHGSHVLGTLLGRDLGGTRIGVARGITDVLVAKVVADNGLGRSEDFLRGALWAMREGAQIAAFSLTFDAPAAAEALVKEDFPQSLATTVALQAHRGNLRIFETLLQMMWPHAPLMLGAVGNDSLRMVSPEFQTGPVSPAAARGVLAIGACGPGYDGLEVASFCNLSPALTAPGVGIFSAGMDAGVRALNGSSMAVAHATGIAALWAEKMAGEGRKITAEAVANALVGSATKQGFAGDPSFFDIGKGMVQAP